MKASAPNSLGVAHFLTKPDGIIPLGISVII
jgi:hypothetical protein